MGTIKGGFPVAKRHDNAIQVRATSGLFEFLAANGAQLVPSLLGGNTINVPPSCSGNKICCAMPAPMCRIQLMPEKLALTPTPPDSLQLSFTTQLKTLDKLPIEYAIPILGNARCLVSFDTTMGTAGHTDIDIVGSLQFSVDATSNLARVALNNAAVNNLDGSMVTLESQPGDLLCTIANIGFIKGLLVPALASALTGNLGGLVSSQLCMKCMTQDDCNSFAAACTNGQCMQSDGKTCVQELGLEGRLDVGAGLASFAPGLRAWTDIIAAAGGYASVDTGLSLGLLGGAQGDPHASCVPMLPPPATPTVAQSRTFFTDVLPDRATPYHLGIGVHRSELDNIGYGLFDGGGLCLEIGTKTVALLSTKTLGLVIRSLADLVHVPDAPMLIQLKPQKPPTFTMGKGTFKLDATGQKVIDDPLLWVALPGLSIDFYAFTDDRYVRIMTLTADVTLGVALETDGNGKLVPVIGDTSHAFKNVVVTNSHLLAEAPSELAKTFPMLLSVAVSQITGALGPIALPSIAGLNLEPVALTSTDPDGSGENQFLAIFANLAPAKTTMSITIDTSAELERLELPPTREFALDGRGGNRPTAWLRLASPAPDAEFSFAVDGGAWSPFSPSLRIGVSDERLWMQGRHYIDVRARRAQLAQTLDPTPARVPFVVDTVAPEGNFDVAGDELEADARDMVTPASGLQIRFSVDNGKSFSAWTPLGRVALPSRAATAALRVEVRDEAGNIGELGRVAGSGGCSIAPGGRGDGDGKLALLVAALLVVLALRRRKMAAIGIGLLFCVPSGCGSLGKGDFEAPSDEIGRYSDVAVASDGAFHISAYDDTMGDLAYARVTDPAKNISWQVVDGIDPTAVAEVKNGYRHGITDPGPDVGRYTSLALTRGGQPRIAYCDVSNGAVKLALGPHPFTTYAIESGSSSAPVGLYAALSLDGNDVPSVAYVATGISDGNGFKSELHVAVAKNATPGARDWSISTVDTTVISCAGRCTTGSACVLTAMVNGKANTDPSYSSCVTVDTTPCSPACTSTQACIKSMCTAVLAPPGAADLVEGTGLFVQARRDNQGRLELIYYDHNKGSLKLATQAGGAWTTTFLDGNMSGVDVGQFASADVAADGSLHVAYVDAIAQQLLYKHISGGAAPMVADVIDDGTRAGDTRHQVGAGTNLVLDGSGQPRVIYQDQTLAALELATGAPMWSHHELAAGEPGFGFYPHQVMRDGQRWLVELVYDRGNGTGVLGTLRLAPMAE
jgi:hypothetical protein